MTIFFPTIMIVACIVLFVRVGVIAYDAIVDVFTKPFNSTYLVTWGITIGLAVTIMSFLGYLIYISFLTVIERAVI